MFLRWGLLFTVVSLVELAILIQLGRYVGLWPTIALIFFTGFFGAYLARQQGLQTLRMIAKSLEQGRIPTRELIDGVCILIASAFLITPGLLTDTAGFLLLLPSVRRLLQDHLQRRMERWIALHTHTITIP